MPTFVTIPAVGTFVTFPIFSGPLLASAMGEVAGRFETVADPDGKPDATTLTDDKAPVDGLPAPGPELVATRPVWGCGSIYKALEIKKAGQPHLEACHGLGSKATAYPVAWNARS